VGGKSKSESESESESSWQEGLIADCCFVVVFDDGGAGGVGAGRDDAAEGGIPSLRRNDGGHDAGASDG